MTDPVSALECAFADFYEVPHVLAMSSGMAALVAALLSLGIDRKREVVHSAYTWPQLAAAVDALGFRVKLVDCDENGRIEVAEVEKPLSPKTGAIVICHLFGNPVDIRAVSGMASEAGVPVIEDCSQAILAWQGGRRVGTWGQIGFASLGAGKVLSGNGGGLLWTNDRSLYREAFVSSQHSSRAKDSRLEAECLRRSLSLQIHPVAAQTAYCDISTLSERGARMARNDGLFHIALGQVPGLQSLSILPDAVSAWQCIPFRAEARKGNMFDRAAGLWWEKQPAYLLSESTSYSHARRFARAVRFLETGRQWADARPADITNLATRI